MKLNKMKFLYGFIAFFQVIANLPSMNNGKSIQVEEK